MTLNEAVKQSRKPPMRWKFNSRRNKWFVRHGCWYSAVDVSEGRRLTERCLAGLGRVRIMSELTNDYIPAPHSLEWERIQ